MYSIRGKRKRKKREVINYDKNRMMRKEEINHSYEGSTAKENHEMNSLSSSIDFSSSGIGISTFFGNFFVRSTDLLSLANCNPDAAVGVQLNLEVR